MSRYAEVWERFKRERRLEFGGHASPNWQAGHALSASFTAPVEGAHLRDLLEPLMRDSAPFPFVSLHHDHFMHITLLLLGFLVREPADENKVLRERLEELAVEAGERCGGSPLSRWNLRTSTPSPERRSSRRDGGRLEKLCQAICYSCGFEKPSGSLHLTLAYLQAADGTPVPDDSSLPSSLTATGP